MSKMSEKVDTYYYKVGTFDVDFRNRLSVRELGKNLLDSANQHAEKRAFGCFEQDGVPYVWVLSRLVIEMDEWPKREELYSISTWVENSYRQFTDRGYFVFNAEGKQIGRVHSVWAMINAQTRQAERLQTLFEGRYEMNVTDEIRSGVQRSRLPQPAETVVSQRQTAYCDLDKNDHVNSIRYLEYALDALPLERMDKEHVCRIEAEYGHEIPAGKMVEVSRETWLNEQCYLLGIRFNATDGAPSELACKVAVTFRK